FGLASLTAPSNANADIINNWAQLMNSSDSQNVQNYGSGYTILGNVTKKGKPLESQDYDIGGLTMDEEGIKISAYLHNSEFSGYPEAWTGAYDRSLLGIGGKPDYWIAVQKIAGYLGETDGSGNLTIAPENKVWTSDDIKFNGTLGAVDEMPGCNSESPVYLDTDIDLVPEPVTVLLLGAGFVGTVLAGRKKA
ncbi:MAG: PEP-CTERM sorting domain-containing protein, partial [Phycisphaerae bacterium]